MTRPQPSAPGTASAPGAASALGARARRRSEARFGIALAAVGILLVIAGIVIWATNYLGAGLRIDVDSDVPRTSGGSRRFLGVGLGAAIVATGYALLIRRRQGPLATAGTIAAALGTPITLTFLTLDVDATANGQLPLNIDVVLLISVLAWLISYFLVPGARGRAVFLGAAATTLVVFLEYKAGGSTTFALAFSFFGGETSTSGLGGVVAIGLIFGLGYYLVAFLLDRSGRPGAAVALVFAGYLATSSGIAAATPSFHQVGTALLLIVIGAAVGWYGGRFGRRFTTWLWSAEVGLGIGLLVQKALPHNATGAGITLIVVGAAVVVAAQVFSSLTHEAPDIVEPANTDIGGAAYGPAGAAAR